jgi:hypothetical protein
MRSHVSGPQRVLNWKVACPCLGFHGSSGSYLSLLIWGSTSVRCKCGSICVTERHDIDH